jgi:hypothetical protein
VRPRGVYLESGGLFVCVPGLGHGLVFPEKLFFVMVTMTMLHPDILYYIQYFSRRSVWLELDVWKDEAEPGSQVEIRRRRRRCRRCTLFFTFCPVLALPPSTGAAFGIWTVPFRTSVSFVKDKNLLPCLSHPSPSNHQDPSLEINWAMPGWHM